MPRYEVDIRLSQRWLMAIEADDPMEAHTIASAKISDVPADEMTVDTKVEKGADRG